MGKIDGNIFQVKSVIKSLNSLLEEAGLKTKRVGDRTLTRDSKSFRNTFIQWMLDKGVPVDRIAKLCGTSTTMIERFYTANTSLQSMLDVMLQTGRSKLRAISNQKQSA
jgi:integrase